jgi:hypothetical protein
MKIKATVKATRRTVNRINEHGRFGFIIAGRKTDGSEWLLRSRLTKWLGWLPTSEFMDAD